GAALLKGRVRVGHQVGPRLAEHHLQIRRLESDVHEAVDHIGRARHAIPRPQHRFGAVARRILDEDLHLPPEDEEHLLDFVRVGGVSLTGRDEHHAQREVLGGNHVRVGLARGSASDEAVLGASIDLDTRIGKSIPGALSIVEPGDLSSQQLLERLRHDSLLDIATSSARYFSTMLALVLSMNARTSRRSASGTLNLSRVALTWPKRASQSFAL